LSELIAEQGYRVISFDRRNCGLSSLDFNPYQSEEDMWLNDLAALLTHLEVDKTFVIGRSRTSRVAMRFALRYRHRILGLGLWGVSGGEGALRWLDTYYFGQYLRACQTDGMAGVCNLDHFAGLLAAAPERRETLLGLDPRDFTTALQCWRNMFLVQADQSVMGFSDRELRVIDVPTAIVPYYDAVHPQSAVEHAAKVIPDSQLFDFDPSAWGRQDTPEAPDQVASILCGFFRERCR